MAMELDATGLPPVGGAHADDQQVTLVAETTPGTPPSGTPQTTTIELDAAGNTVHLPAGTDTSHPVQVGNDLEFIQPDGSIVLIPNGAVAGLVIFVGDIEIPADTVAALFSANNITPAEGGQGGAGGSHGNYDDPGPKGIGESFGVSGLLAPSSLNAGGPGANDLQAANLAPVFLNGPIFASVSEEGLGTGNPDTNPNPDDTTDKVFITGFLGGFDANSDPLTYSLTPVTALQSDGFPVTWTGSGTNVLVGSANGNPVLIISVVNSSGQYTVTLLGPIDHPVANTEDDLPVVFNVTVKDTFGASASTTFTLSIEDDSPIVNSTQDTFRVDEDGLAAAYSTGNQDDGTHGTSSITGTLNIKWGADNEDAGSDTTNPDGSFVQDGALGAALTGRSLAFSSASPLSTVAGQQFDGATLRSHGDLITLQLSENGTKLVGVVLGDENTTPRTVFEVTLSDDGNTTPAGTGGGAFNFKLFDQLDHASGSGENDLTLTFNIVATDFDHDSATGSFSVIVNDDTPVLNSEASVSLTVDEDDIRTGSSLGTSPNDGNSDGSFTGAAGVDGPGPANATSASGSLLNLLVRSGADESVTFGFVSDSAARTALEAQGLKSDGSVLSYQVVGNTLYGFVNAGAPGVIYNEGQDRLVFKLEITNSSTGEYKFSLYDQLDHADGNGQNNLAIKLGGTLQATDYDGDWVTLTDRVTVNVTDDVPVINGTTSLKVDEDDIDTSLSLGSQPNDGNADGSFTGPGGVDSHGPANASGSLSALVTAGADEPVTYGFVSEVDARAYLTALHLHSQGGELSYQLVGNTLVGFVDDSGLPNQHSYDQNEGDREVFTLQLDPATGKYTFSLYDQLDHASGNGQNDLAFDVGGVFQVTDFDKDSVGFTGKVTIHVTDDVPVITGNSTIKVDEDDIDTSSSLGTQPNDGDSTDGSFTGPGGVDTHGPANASGTLASVVTTGADDALTYSFMSESAVHDYLTAYHLHSQGSELSYDLQGDTLYGFVNAGGQLGTSYDIPADRKVFTLELDPATGKYTFSLFDQLDHAPGNAQNDLAFDIGGLFKATDYDGDAVNLTGKVTVHVTDDVPVLSSHAPVSLTVDEDDIRTNSSLGTSPNDGNGDGSFTGPSGDNNPGPANATSTSGSLLGLVVSSGADEKLTFGFIDEGALRDFMNTQHLTSGGAALSYDLQDNTLYGFVNAGGQPGTSYDIPADREVFSLQVNPTTGAFTFSLYDQLDHPTGNGQNTLSIDFGAGLQATDYDGDSVALTGKVSVNVTDDVPQADLKIDSNDPYLTVDETVAGTQGDEPGSAALFTGLPHQGHDNAMAAQYATDSDLFITSATKIGADEPATTRFWLDLTSTPAGGLDSHLTTSHDHREIYLFEESYGGKDYIVGRYDAVDDGNSIVNSSDPAAFALYVDPGTGAISVALFESLDNPTPGSSDEPLYLGNNLILAKYTVTDKDGDPSTASVDLGNHLRFLDDGPTLREGTDVKLVNEDDIDTDWSQGSSQHTSNQTDPDNDGDNSYTENGPGSKNPAFTSGSLAALVNTGADDPLTYGFTSDIRTALANLHLASEQSGQNVQLTYSTSTSGGWAILTGTEPDLSSSDHHDTGNIVFELRVNTTTGAYEFRLFDELVHVAPPAGQSDENTTLAGTGLPADGALQFGNWITVTDADGDSITLGSHFQIKIKDDVPTAHIELHDSDHVPVGVTIDETVGWQDDDTNWNSVSAQFSTVLNKGDDPDVNGSGAINFARSDDPVVEDNSVVGADSPESSHHFSLAINGAEGLDSGLMLTDGTKIYLHLDAAGRIIGTVDPTATDGFAGKTAFAVAIDEGGYVSTAQYLSLQNPTPGSSYDETVNLSGKINAVLTVTDGDGDTSPASSVGIGQRILFSDDGPTVSSNDTVTVEDDDLLGGNEGGPGDDFAPQHDTGVLSHNFGSDGGSLAWLLTGAPSGFSYVAGSNGSLLVQQGGTTVLTVTVDSQSGAYTVVQNHAVDHPSLNGQSGDDSENNVQFNLTYRVTDGDGDTVDGSLKISVDDDTPESHYVLKTGILLTSDETPGLQNATASPGVPGDANDEDVAGPFPVAVANPGSDGHMTTNYAQSNGSFLTGVPNYGADGPGSTIYSLNVHGGDSTQGVDSGLATTDGTKIYLFEAGANLVVGRYDGLDSGSGTGNGDPAAFAVYVDPNTGVVSVVQYVSLKHDDRGDFDEDNDNGTNANDASPDDSHTLQQTISDALRLTITTTDHDGDSVDQTFAIGRSISFEDDGPSLALITPTVVNGLDFGTFALNGNAWGNGSGTATGTNGGWTIAGTPPDGSGAVQLERVGDGYLGMHSSSGSYMVDLDASPHDVKISQTLIGLNNGQTYDLRFEAGAPSPGSSHLEVWFGGSKVADISPTSSMQPYLVTLTGGSGTSGNNLLEFRETGAPDNQGTYLANISVGDIVIDETYGIDANSNDVAPNALFDAITHKGVDGDMGGVPEFAQGHTALVTVNANFGADGPKNGSPTAATTYALSTVDGSDSGLTTTAGQAIHLFNETYSGVSFVVGRYDSNGTGGITPADDAAFAFRVDPSSGVLSIVQYVSLHQPNTASHDEGVYLKPGSLSVSVTITDGDNDTATQTADVSASIRFEDDGPHAVIAASGTLIIDESAGDQAGTNDALGSSNTSAVFPGVFGMPIEVAIGAASAVSISGTTYGADGQGIGPAYSLNVSSPGGVDSQLDATDGRSIFLFKEGNLIVGREGTAGGLADNAGTVAFAISIDGGTGTLTVAQYVALHHPDPADPDEAGAPLTIAANVLQATVTVTDGDGDTSVASVGIGAQIAFRDDGPSLAPAPLNQISNGDFTQGTWSAPQWWGESSTDVTGWAIAQSPVEPVLSGTTDLGRSPNGYLGMTTSNGAEMIDLGSSPGNIQITQTFGSGQLTAGQSYAIQFEAGAPFPETAKLEVMWRGQVIGTIDPSGPGQLTSYSYIVTAGGDANDALTFREIGLGDNPVPGTWQGHGLLTEGYHGTYLANVRMATTYVVDEDGLPSGNHDVPPSEGDAAGLATGVTGVLGINWGADNFDAAAADGNVGNTALNLLQDNASSAGAGRSVTFSDTIVDIVGGTLTSKGDVITVTANADGTILTGTAVHNGVPRTVFEVSLSDDGTGAFRFILHDAVDHAANGSENDVNLTFHYTAKDSDGDTVNGSFSVGVDDDLPVATGVTQSAGVYESELATGTEYPAPDDKNHDGGGGDAKFTGNLSGLVSFGADGPGSYVVDTTHLAPELLALTSGGVPLTYTVDQWNTLIGWANGVDVLEFNVDPHNGQYFFWLKGPLDHTGGNDTAIVLDMSSAVRAVDGDGDSLALSGRIAITVHDDNPVVGPAQAPVWFTDNFDGAPTGGYFDGPPSGYGHVSLLSSGTNGINTRSGTGNYALLTQSGTLHADATGPFTRFDGYKTDFEGGYVAKVDVYIDPAHWGLNEGFDYSVAANGQDGNHVRDFIFHLTSDGSGHVLVGADNNSGDENGPVPAGTLAGYANHGSVTQAGWYTLEHVFHAAPDGSLAVDLVLLDGDGNTVFTQTLNTPTDSLEDIVGGNRYGWFTTITVDGGLAVDNLSLSALGAQVDEDDLGNGSDTAKESTSITAGLSVSWGADNHDADGAATGDRHLVFTTAGAPAGLKSHGVDVDYVVGTDASGNGMLTAYRGTTHDDAHKVFTVTLNDDAAGSYTFTLQGPLDHPTDDGQNDLPLTFSFNAVDSDGDAAGGSFTVNVHDDVPMAHAEDPVIFNEDGSTGGNVLANDVQGADGATLTDVKINGDADFTALSTITPDGNGVYTIDRAEGTYTFKANGDWSFTPAANYNGPAGFSYEITDGDGDKSDPNVGITITVNPVNDAPTISGALTEAVRESGDVANINEAGPTGPLEPATSLLTLAITTELGTLLTTPGNLTTVLADVTTALGSASQAIAVIWDYLDDIYTSAGPNQIHVNEAFTRLGAAYASMLKAGTIGSLIDVTAKYTPDNSDPDTLPQRNQSLHDNLLGNLTNYALDQRYGAADTGLRQDLGVLVNDVDPALLSRPYFEGNQGESDAAERAWDVQHGYVPAASGQLTVIDPDVGDTHTWSDYTASGTYGTFTLDAAGKWTYVLDDARAATQALSEGETHTETFSVTVTDSHGATGTQQVVISVTGSNDAPVIAGASTTEFYRGFDNSGDTIPDHDDASNYYGQVQLVASGAGGIATTDGQGFALVSEVDNTGPYTRFDGYRGEWPGDWTSDVKVYLDTGWPAGSGFDYSVASSAADGGFLRDFIFHVTKDTSTGQLLVGGSNNSNFAPREDLESINHYTVTQSGWYTLEHQFRDNNGVLEVHLNLVDASGAVVWTETRSTATDTIPDVVGGNRYGWFTFVDVPGGLPVDGLSLDLAGAQLFEFAEGSPNEGIGVHTTVGDIAFSDVDLLDVHSASAAPKDAGYVGSFSVSVSDDTTGDGAGKLHWTFSVDDAVIEHLGSGQTMVQTYTVTVADGHGGIDTVDIPVTIVGTNDAPTISGPISSSVLESGDVTNIDEAGPTGPLEPVAVLLTPPITTALGTLLTTPGNLTTVLSDVTAALGGAGHENQAIAVIWDYLDDIYTSAGPNQIHVNEAFTRLGAAYASMLKAGTIGSLIDVTAKYTPDNGDIDTLPQRNQSLHDNLLGNLTNYALDQRYGAADTGLRHDLGVLVNDVDPALLSRPYFEGNQGDSDAAERAWDVQHGYVPAASGQLTVNDLDSGDTHTWSGYTASGTYGTFTLDAAGKWTYVLDDARPETQALKSGETQTETFSVSVSDNHGGVGTQQVTITVTGSNDAPVIVSSVAMPFASGTLHNVQQADAGHSFEPATNVDGTISVGLYAANSRTDMDALLATVQAALPAGATTADAIASVWDYIDDVYSTPPGGLHYYDVPLNKASVLLALSYAHYLQGGGLPLTDIVAKFQADGGDVDTLPDRSQPLHENILGALDLPSIDDKFSPNPATHDAIIQQITDAGLLGRPIYGGYEGTDGSAARTWDQDHGLVPLAQGQLTATDVDHDATQTWSSSGPGVYGSFIVDGTGAWHYTVADNAATRALAQGQTATEIYTVTVSDGLGGVDTIRIPVTITGINDAPTDIALGSTTLPANNGTGTIVGSVTVTDVDSTAFTFDTHNPNFAVTGTPGNYQLVVTNHVDSLPASITITAIDDGGLSYSESFALTLPIQLFDSTGHLLSSYSTIQGAVNGATDAAGQYIVVPAGTYDEDVTIDRGVEIRGANSGQPGAGARGAESVIDGQWTITTNHAVDIDGFKFDNTSPSGSTADATIAILKGGDGAGHVIENTVFYSDVSGGDKAARDDRAIFVSNAAVDGSVTIDHNLITGDSAGKYSTASWGRGIWSDGGGTHLTISNNTIDAARSAINLDDDSPVSSANPHTDVTGNTFNGVGTAISLGANWHGDISSSFSGNVFTNVDLEFNAQNLSNTISLNAGSGVAAYGDVAGDGPDNDAFQILGGTAGDALVGTSASDWIVGNGGADDLTGGGADDVLFGGAGVDTAHYSTTLSVAKFSFDIATQTWTVTTGTSEGTDHLQGVEVATDGTHRFLLVGAGGFAHIQDAIDAAQPGDTILIAPGTYVESHTTASGAAGLYINTPDLTLRGFSSVDGSLITSESQVQAGGPLVISGNQNNFGANHWIDTGGTNTVIEGLHLQAGSHTNNKLLEVWADNVTLKYDFIDVNAGGTTYTYAAAVYLNDNGTTASDTITTYTIDHNILNEGIIVSNGVGVPPNIGAAQLITNNQFIGTFDPSTGEGRYDTIVVNGQVAGIGWLLEPSQTPTITGNSFANNTTPFLLRGSDNDAANLPSAAQIQAILDSNGDANLRYVYVVDSAGHLVTALRNDGSGAYHSFAVTNTIDTLNLALDNTPDSVFGGKREYEHAGDTLIVQSGATGTLNSAIMVDDLTVIATVNSADLNLTLATSYADGTPIPSGGVVTITLGDYAPGAGANVDVTGNALDNIMTDNSGHNVLSGMGGNDTFNIGADLDAGPYGPRNIALGTNASRSLSLTGLAGTADTIDGGAGTGDKIVLNAGTHNGFVLDDYNYPGGVVGVEQIEGTSGNDIILMANGYLSDAAGGGVIIDGNGGDDAIQGGAGSDTLNGGNGNDLISGLGGDDVITGGLGDDEIYAGAGNDRILYTVGDGDDVVDGGNDSGGPGPDYDILGITGDATARTFTVGKISGGTEIDPHAIDSSAVDATDLFITYTGPNAGSIRADEIERVKFNLSADDTIVFGDTTGTSLASNTIFVTSGGGNNTFDLRHYAGISTVLINDTDDTNGGDTDVVQLSGKRVDWTITQSGQYFILTNGSITIQATNIESYFFQGENGGVGASVPVSMLMSYVSSDPLILDLNGDGVHLNAAASFDLNHDGQADRIAWPGPHDGMLVADLDHSGKIESGNEVFSPSFGEGGHANSLDALKTYDSNGDGKVTADDAHFADIGLWTDSNGNGVSDDGELHSLGDLGVVGIDLGAEEVDFDLDGSHVFAQGTFELSNGETHQFLGVDLGPADPLAVPPDATGAVQTGTDGADSFAITNLNAVDFIADYNFEQGDSVDLSALLGNNSGATADNAADYVHYDNSTGHLSVDTDGAANGSNFVDVAILNTPVADVKVILDDGVDVTINHIG